MKVIDLLNKIANNEEVPLFKYEEKVYKYNKNNKWLDELYNDEYCKCKIDFCELNDEVEILEEDKKIENIDMFDYFTGYDFNGTSKELLKHLEHNFEEINSKFNELIDEVNKLKGK